MDLLHRLLELVVPRGKGELGCEAISGAGGGGQMHGDLLGGSLRGSHVLPEQAPATCRESHLASLVCPCQQSWIIL